MKIINMVTKVFAVAGLLVALSTPLAFAASTSSGSGGEACQAVSQLDPGKGANCNSSGPSVNKLISLTVNLLTFAAAVIAIIMIIVSGLKYITSQGDANSASSAKKTLLYSIIGLVIVVIAQLIVKFVLAKAK